MLLKESLFTAAQHLLPHHTLSRLIGYLTECQWAPLKNWAIKRFIKRYNVNMQEALEPNPEAYADFNDFFVRALNPDARSIVQDSHAIACPNDGSVSQIGRIEQGRLYQAKGHDFSLLELLGGCEQRAALFDEGAFATLYLSPKDYHRVHMPYTGKLKQMIYIPGKLFSVSQHTTRQIPQLFSRNERVVCIFDTNIGPMAVILVGAMIVASISVTWAGTVTPPQGKAVKIWDYDPSSAITLSKGEEVGQFKLGSTAIVLFAKDKVTWDRGLGADAPVQLGQSIATINSELSPS